MKIIAILFSSMLLGLMMGSCHSEQKVPEGEFLIEGFVKNLPDSSIVCPTVQLFLSVSLRTDSMRTL